MYFSHNKKCLMVMIKLVQKEGAKNAKNYFMFLRLVNFVLNVLGNKLTKNFTMNLRTKDL